ncbi:succinic semialdehyde dehydrogenase [Nocardia pseudobrasiliensis]|nr:succinic semialdehyde dehydrogenase [Nocardia pseudobrasiliensis]
MSSTPAYAELARQLWSSGPQTTTVAPATGQPLATLRLSNQADFAVAFDRARKAQQVWATLSPRNRAALALTLHDLILGDNNLIEILQAETGKLRGAAVEESLTTAGVALYYARNTSAFLKPRARTGAIPLATRAVELRHPKGIVGVISPWSSPLAHGVSEVIPALLAGNAVVHKPDTQTVLTTLYVRQLLIRAGLPADLWQVVVGEHDAIGAVIAGADHICFAGPTTMGRHVAEAAGRRLIDCTLELHGKNPMLVLDDADVELATTGAVRACFSAGPHLSTERIYLAEQIFDDFVPRFIAKTRQLVLETLTNPGQLERVRHHVDDARLRGARILSGGKARPDLGPLVYEPTILTGITPAMAVHHEPTFGPVVSIYRCTDDEHAVTLANDSDYGLNACIWTRDLHRGRHLATRIQCGTVNINDGYASAQTSVDAPVGGMKASGHGRRHGEHGLIRYTDIQTVASRHVPGFDPPPGLGMEPNSEVLALAYRLMQTMRRK